MGYEVDIPSHLNIHEPLQKPRPEALQVPMIPKKNAKALGGSQKCSPQFWTVILQYGIV